jgi:hypothetical protein
MMKRTAEASQRFKSGTTAVFYLLTIALGGLVLSVHGRLALAVDLTATACYIAATALFYDLSRPVHRDVLQPRRAQRWQDHDSIGAE